MRVDVHLAFRVILLPWFHIVYVDHHPFFLLLLKPAVPSSSYISCFCDIYSSTRWSRLSCKSAGTYNHQFSNSTYLTICTTRERDACEYIYISHLIDLLSYISPKRRQFYWGLRLFKCLLTHPFTVNYIRRRRHRSRGHHQCILYSMLISTCVHVRTPLRTNRVAHWRFRVIWRLIGNGGGFISNWRGALITWASHDVTHSLLRSSLIRSVIDRSNQRSLGRAHI
jgi:hypothetical protein